MRSTRGPYGADSSRTERADAAARRLALLAADLGAIDPDLSLESLSGDYTRVVPARRAVPIAPPGPPELSEPEPTGPGEPEPAEVPRPGRHADRRRPAWTAFGIRDLRLPGLGAPQLAVLAVIVAVGVALTAWWVVRDQASPAEPAAARLQASAEPLVTGSPPGDPSAPGSVGGTVTVDVTGKVRRPGIVVLDGGSRVVDALKAAGGERDGVDLSTLNLARVLVDGEQIVVGAAQAAAPAMPTGSPPAGAPPSMVNLNTASQAELETLPDVGPVTALAIVAWRDQHGGFTSVDELLEVDGIGDVTLAKLTPYVTV
jgi:competence protein ComEA